MTLETLLFEEDDEDAQYASFSIRDSRAIFRESTLYQPIVPWFQLNAPVKATKANVSPSIIITPDDRTETFTKGTPSDPDTMAPGQTQWHLVGTWGLHADQVWTDYTGSGIRVGVLDDGFQHNHWDIAANYRTDLDRDIPNGDNDSAPYYTNDNHGTSVIGTIIADDNGLGGVGVAFDAEAYGIRLDFGGAGTIGHTITGFQYAYSTTADVLNNSWGYTTQFADTTNINFAGQDFIDIINEFQNLTEDGRGGLGTNIVFAAGNARTDGDNVNYHNMQNSEYVITVAAIDSDGTYSYFSTPGAALLVAAGGTTVWVPDRTGASGYNSGGDYTNFSGTSAAAPIVSGAIAVILEANPNLGWRDVQEILAYSAQHNDSAGGSWQYNGASNWNGGGLHFSHDYGFGAVDLYRAVRLAETWDLQQTSSNWTVLSPVTNSSSVAIPTTGTITSTITISQDVEIERVQVNLNISHARAGDLVVTLISPDGTESVLIDRPTNGAFTSIYSFSGINFETTSNAHWGESSVGTWTLRVQDSVSGNSGTLNNWSLSFTGNGQTADDQYIYTEDFGNFTGSEYTARSILTDAGGTDTVNISTVSSTIIFNMTAGMYSLIAGNALQIASGTVIENLYTGDGADVITTNSANNIIKSGRGDDLIAGSEGNDTIDGGDGSDRLTYTETIANFSFNFINSLTVHITHLGSVWTDIITSVENFVFSGVYYTFAELEAYAIGGPTAIINGTAAIDTINGDSANNTINGLAGADKLYGKSGNDTLNGGDNDDTLYGETGNDTLNGDDGNDKLVGGDGDDILNGGAGNDTLDGGAGDDTLDGSTGNDTIYGSVGTDTARYNANSVGFIVYRDSAAYLTVVDTSGTYGADRIYNDIERIQFNDTTIDLTVTTFTVNGGGWGTAAAINGTVGADTLNGALANDTINGDNGNDKIYGKSGNDTLNGDDGDDIVYGDDGNDTINGGNGSDSLSGGGGNDAINGDAGNDVLDGGDGDDILNGGAGNDTLYGGNGNDIARYNVNSAGFVVYRENASYLTVVDTSGALGTDKLYNIETIQFNDSSVDLLTSVFSLNGGGWGSSAAVIGTSGADTLNGTSVGDTVNGGSGNDKIYGKAGDDMLYGDDGDDVLWGEAGSDILHGGNGNDTIMGGDGDDTILGNTGNDLIDAGAGDDRLAGGEGTDSLYGGAGNDIFVFLDLGSGVDVVGDYQSGEKLDITDLLTGFDQGMDDISDFLQIAHSSANSKFYINADGIGTDFVLAFTVNRILLSGNTAQMLLDADILVVS